ncbi:MAG: hypothetical protein ACPGFC_03375, partial [Paracoccaceae bacterium]
SQQSSSMSEGSGNYQSFLEKGIENLQKHQSENEIKDNTINILHIKPQNLRQNLHTTGLQRIGKSWPAPLHAISCLGYTLAQQYLA